ncbi:MAG: hypothetical protein ABI036_10390 [Fibrobacteria bacterium]
MKKNQILNMGCAMAFALAFAACNEQPTESNAQGAPEKSTPNQNTPFDPNHVDVWTSDGEFHGSADEMNAAFAKPLAKRNDGSPTSLPIYGLTFIDNSNGTCPSGYFRINKDLNEGAGGDYIYLCYTPYQEATYPKRTWPEDDGYFISHRPFGGNYDKWPTHFSYTSAGSSLCNNGTTTSVKAGCPWSNGPSFQPGSWNRANGDLNSRTGGEFIFFFSKSTSAAFPNSGITNNKLYGVGIISGTSSNLAAPAGWVRNSVDLNVEAGGKYVYFIHKTTPN